MWGFKLTRSDKSRTIWPVSFVKLPQSLPAGKFKYVTIEIGTTNIENGLVHMFQCSSCHNICQEKFLIFFFSKISFDISLGINNLSMIDLAESGLPGRSILSSQGSHWRKINSTQWGICYYYLYLTSIIFECYHLLFIFLIDWISSFISRHLREKILVFYSSECPTSCVSTVRSWKLRMKTVQTTLHATITWVKCPNIIIIYNSIF